LSWSCPAKITFFSLVIKTKSSEIVRFQTNSPCFIAGPIWEQSYRKYHTFNSMTNKTPSYIPLCRSKYVWFHEPWLNIHDINSNLWLYKLSQDWTYTTYFFCSLNSVRSYNDFYTDIRVYHQLTCMSVQTDPKLKIYDINWNVCLYKLSHDWTYVWHPFTCMSVQIEPRLNIDDNSSNVCLYKFSYEWTYMALV
jgi:hypothetical protein